MPCVIGVVARFTAETGVTATIFVKSDDDFVRISTSIKKQSGERALGTALNRAHPGYSRLIAVVAGGCGVQAAIRNLA